MLSQSKSKEIWIIILCMRGLMLSEGGMGGSYRVMSSVQWGWFSHPSGRSISHLWGSSTILGEKHPCLKKSQICIDPQLLCQVAFSLSQLWQSFNHGKSFIMTFKDEIFMPHAMGWRVPRFLNIQICARCRGPNMKYLCLRVTQSRADEIFRSLPRVTQISSQNFCRPRFYGGI